MRGQLLVVGNLIRNEARPVGHLTIDGNFVSGRKLQEFKSHNCYINKNQIHHVFLRIVVSLKNVNVFSVDLLHFINYCYIDIVCIVVFFVLFEHPFSSVLLPATVNCAKNDR